jgi:uncharacterized protein YutE (UPF0331/DUF86 family)
MLNRLLINQRLALIMGYLSELEKLSQVEREEFVADKIKAGAAESFLRRSLEAIFDIGRHILAKTGSLDMAMEYKAIAAGLVERGIVNRELGLKLKEMAGYRNRLVHLYNEITDEELHQILSEDLPDITEFVKYIRDFLTRSTP